VCKCECVIISFFPQRLFDRSFICGFIMADSNFDNGFEKVPAAGEFLASGGVEEVRGTSAMSSQESTSKPEKASCKFALIVYRYLRTTAGRNNVKSNTAVMDNRQQMVDFACQNREGLARVAAGHRYSCQALINFCALIALAA